MFYHVLGAFNGILSHDTKIHEQLQWLKVVTKPNIQLKLSLVLEDTVLTATTAVCVNKLLFKSLLAFLNVMGN